MKKKVKLLTSIASLGLALALMTFGVLAAASHTLDVSSNVGFSVGDHIAFTLSGAVTDSQETPNTGSYALKTVIPTNNDDVLTDWTDYDTAVVDPDHRTITYTFNIDNTGSKDIYISMSSPVTPEYFNDETLTLGGADGTHVVTVAEQTYLKIAADAAAAGSFTVVYNSTGSAKQSADVAASVTNKISFMLTFNMNAPA